MNFVEFKNLENGYDVVNIGSGPSKNDFEWSAMSDVKGYNFAVAPEDFRYDARIVKNYGKYVRKGGLVLIVICPLSFAENSYLLRDDFSFKYVKSLPASDVDLPLWKYTFFRNPLCIFLYETLCRCKNKLRRILRTIKKKEHGQHLSPEEILVNGWLKDNPYLANLKDLPEQDLSGVFDKKRNELYSVINECISASLHPVLILPPVSKKLQSFFSAQFLKMFVYDILEKMPNNIPIFDYMKDEKFQKDEYFTNGLFLKKEYAQIFTRDVMNRAKELDFTFIGVNKMKTEKQYKIGNDLNMPWIFFGSGVVWKYTRNPILWFKVNLEMMLSAVKHLRLPRELYNNVHINRILRDAYKVGFRGFDTARIYGLSEKKIGKLNSKYDDIWVNTKCSVMDIERKQSPNTVDGNLEISKSNLRTNEIKSLLLHWPEGDKWIETYREIVEEYNKEKIRVYGMSNARLEDLQKVKDAGLPLPMIIQNEIHPLNIQKNVRDFCYENNIQIMAHTPTAKMCKKISMNDTLQELSKKYCKSVAQIIIRWHYQNNIIPVVSSTNKKHMKENLDIFDFELTSEEMKLIDSLDDGFYFITSRGIDDPNYIYNQ